jgi:hypothetical protein
MRPGNRDVVILDHTDNTQRLGLPEFVEGYELVDDGETAIRWMPGVKRQVVGSDGLLFDSDEEFKPPIDLAKLGSTRVDYGLLRLRVRALLREDPTLTSTAISKLIGVCVNAASNIVRSL